MTELPSHESADTTVDDHKEYWIYTSLSIPLSVIAIYVWSSQVWYAVKTPDTKRFKARRLNYLNVLSATCAFLRAAVDFRLTVGVYSDIGCDLAIKFKLTNSVLTTLTVYTVLWLRQRAFYQHDTLKHLSSKIIRTISWSMSIVLFVGLTTTSALFFAVGKYVGNREQCTIYGEGPFYTVRWILMIGCTTSFQISLLALFVYPLVKHKVKTPQNRREDRIIPVVKRATVISVLCILADVLCGLIVLILDKAVVNMSTFIYDVHGVFTVVYIILSFPNYKVRLIPWRLGRSNRNETFSTGSTDTPGRVIVIEG